MSEEFKFTKADKIEAPSPKENPLLAIQYSKVPRHVPLTEDLPEELTALADDLARLAAQGVTWNHMAGRVGLMPEELRKMCVLYPALHRAVAYGHGLGADEMSAVVYEDAVVQRNAETALAWLKLRGGWQEPKTGTSIKIDMGAATVAIDLDRLRTQAADQSALLEYDGESEVVDI